MRFLSVSHSANALLVRRGLFSPAESFYACMHKTWNGLHWKKAPAGCTVAVHWHAFCLELLCSLSCTCPDYYLTCSGSTGGARDTDRMFSGRLLTRNTWKLMNNGCWNGGPRDQTDDIHLLGDNKTWLVQKCSSNVQRTFCQLLMHYTFVLPCTCPLLIRWCPLIDR